MSRGRTKIAVWIAGALLVTEVASAARAQPETTQPSAVESHFLAAERVAEAITLATGVPISPLLGVSGLGAYRWWRTPAVSRAGLPWYARPWYWGTGLFLAALFALNTTIGGLLPGLKKPMDFVEHYENQVSALVASPIVLFEVFRIVDRLPGFAEGGTALLPASLAASGVAAIASMPAPVAWLAKLGTAALVLLAFAVVFIAFHAIQVLITLSPSAVLDLLLRLFRVATLSLLALAAVVHPYVGAVAGLLILFAALLIAGWSFRLTVWGWVFAGDTVRRRVADTSGAAVAFAARSLVGPAARSYGRIEVDAAGGRRFAWRPWLVLPRRSVPIAGVLVVRRGVLSPALVSVGGAREQVVARFPPRYQGLEEALSRSLGAAGVLDSRLALGLEAAWRWLLDTARGDGGAELAG